jgi:hypothetical protein
MKTPSEKPWFMNVVFIQAGFKFINSGHAGNEVVNK